MNGEVTRHKPSKLSPRMESLGAAHQPCSPDSESPATSRWSPTRKTGTLVLLIGLLATSSGCSRAFWRQQADRDAYEAISQRMTDPRWQVPRFDVTPDADSRFFDPYDADCAPLPPDDPAAHEYMHCVDGIKSYKSWHKLGDSFSVENPHWLAKYGLTPDMINPATGDYTGRLPTLEKLTLAQCVELSQIHSRELQTQIENLYLAALDVTFERYQFNVRYLPEPFANLTNTFLPWRTGDNTSANSGIGVSKLLPAGGQVAVELANNTLWLFSSPTSTNSASILSFSLVQPLMAGAGRKVVLENLTQSERDLLYQTRTLARFRQTLFTNIVSDGGGSYLNLIQQIQQIRNQQQNIERLKRQVTSLQSNASQKGNIVRAELAAMPADVEIPELIKAKLVYDPERQMLLWMDNVITPEELKVLDGLTSEPDLRAAIQEIVQTISVVPTSLDVLQLLNTLANANNSLRSQERGLQDGLDTFKISLGLPPDLTLTIDDSMLEPFMFIDPQLSGLETEITDYVPNSWSKIDEQAPTQLQLQLANNELDQLVNRVQTEVLAILDQDVANLNGSMEKILGRMDSAEEQERLKTDVGRDLRSLESARNRLIELRRSTQLISEEIEKAGNAPADVVPPADPAEEDDDSGEKPTPQQELRLEILSVHQDLLQIIRNLTVVQAGLRVDQIVVPEFTIPMEEVVQHAVENRVDLMNLRATVVDARRKVEIAGNLLQSNVDVIVDGDIRNSGGNRPFDFQGDRSQIRAGLRFTAPLDQIQERNSYRSTLISYQRARRDYLALEDTVKNQVRRNWRQLAVLKRNVDTSRLALRLAAKQYESAVDESTAPAPVGGGSGTRSGGLQGTNLTNALNSIISAQNSLIGFWVQYEQNRLGIYRDMGMMEIGPDGIWNDSIYRGSLDQDTQEGLPARQTLPDGGPDDGQPETIPTPLDADGLGARRDRRSRDGGSGEAAGVVFAADGEFEGGLLPVQYETGGEEVILDLSARAGESGQPGERGPE